MSLAPTSLAQVVLKPRKAAPFWGRHPWVLDTAIARTDSSAVDGEPVDLMTETGRWIARGIYNSCSRIRVRLYSWDPEAALDEALWRSRIEGAVALRRSIGYDDPQGAVRMVYSEADLLSGLIVDRYAGHFEEMEISEEEQKALLEALWSIMVAFVDLGYSADKLGDIFERIFDPQGELIHNDDNKKLKEKD